MTVTTDVRIQFFIFWSRHGKDVVCVHIAMNDTDAMHCRDGLHNVLDDPESVLVRQAVDGLAFLEGLGHGRVPERFHFVLRAEGDVERRREAGLGDGVDVGRERERVAGERLEDRSEAGRALLCGEVRADGRFDARLFLCLGIRIGRLFLLLLHEIGESDGQHEAAAAKMRARGVESVGVMRVVDLGVRRGEEDLEGADLGAIPAVARNRLEEFYNHRLDLLRAVAHGACRDDAAGAAAENLRAALDDFVGQIDEAVESAVFVPLHQIQETFARIIAEYFRFENL